MAVEYRDNITSFALTATEKKRVKKVCEKLSVRMSDYIRDIVLKQVVRDEK